METELIDRYLKNSGMILSPDYDILTDDYISASYIETFISVFVEDSSAEEGSMFGNFFVQKISDPAKSPTNDETVEKKNDKEDAFAQSGEIVRMESVVFV